MPLTVAEKFVTIDEDDNIITKHRLAHDCTRPGLSGQSVNNMIDDDLLEPCRFGFVFLQILYAIHSLRLHFPTIPILLNKYDLDAAFRRLSVTTKCALLCAVMLGTLIYVCLRLPFGAKPAPASFSILSEFVAELAQTLIFDQSWDPHHFQSILLDPIDTSPLFQHGDIV